MMCLSSFRGKKSEIHSRMSGPSTCSTTESQTPEHNTRRSVSGPTKFSIATDEALGSLQSPCMSCIPNNLKVFTLSELKSATKNFSRSLMIGEGGFGCVYKGAIKSLDDPRMKTEVAIKQLNRKGLQGHKEWLTEVNILGAAEHPNLVKLLGYCAEDDERGIQRLLVYEFMPNKSVADHLSTHHSPTLTWAMRLRVALDAARGLTYLHEEMSFQIIFRDFKTPNILLDEHWSAKLSDFGLARHGPTEGLSHVSTAVVGTEGYAAPEYLRTGRLTAKSDIWSYGVVLYELITGRRPVDRNLPKSEQKLLEWVKPCISDINKFHLIVDPRLQSDYSLKSATKLASIANKCLVREPKSRPKMSDIMEMVQRIVLSTETGDPQAPLSTPSEGDQIVQKNKRLSIKKMIGIGNV